MKTNGANMTRGRPPMHGVSSTFFKDPVLLSMLDLTGERVGEYVEYYQIEELVCKKLGINILWKGRQPTTNRPLVRVWIGNIISKLRADGLLSANNSRSALTDLGLDEAKNVYVKCIQNPITVPDAPSSPVPPPSPSEGDKKKSEEELRLELEEKEKKELAEKEKAARKESSQKIKNGDAIDFGGITVDINKDVPDTVCLPLPEAYAFPKVGAAAKQLREAVISMKNRRSIYIWGLPGSGKDAFVHAFSSLTHTPTQIFTVSPNEDIQSWFYIRSFEKSGTSWEEGAFLKAARDGYTAPSGKVYPYTILVSDLDRATKNQAEALRLIMDTIQGRVMGPGGVKYKVLPGTQIVATANSSGSGDSRGRCVSSNVLDASILDRFERKFKFDTLEWIDEVEILKVKFPTFNKKVGTTMWANIGEAVKALRKGVEEESIFAEFGHRSVCSWIGHSQDIIDAEYSFSFKLKPNEVGSILRRGALVLYDAMPDDQTRTVVQRILDPYIKEGVVGK